MRKSATSFVLAGLLFLGPSTTAVLAQMGTPAMSGQRAYRMQPPDPARQLERMTARLSLTADQRAQIKPVLESRKQQCQAVQADTGVAGPDKMAKMKAIHEDTYSKIQAILNDKQKEQWAQMPHQGGMMQGCMQKRMGGMGSY